MRYCGYCGAQLEDNARFCPKCGQTAQPPVQQAPPTYTQPAQPYNPPQQPYQQQPYQQPVYPPYQQPYRQPYQPIPEKKPGKLWLWILLGVLALAAIGVGVWFLLKSGSQTPGTPAATSPTESVEPTKPTAPPETEPPVTEPPETEPPETEPPETEPPETEPPETEPPETEPQGTWRQTRIDSYLDDGSFYGHGEYQYDALGRLQYYYWYTADGAVESRETYEYDAQGRNVKTVFYHYNADGTTEVWHYELNTFDAQDRVIKTENYDYNRTLYLTETFTYDAQGRELEALEDYAEGYYYRYVYDYSCYDAENRVLCDTYLSNGEWSDQSEFRYDGQGNLIWQQETLSDGTVGIAREYQLDEYGNAVKELCYYEGALSTTYINTFEFVPD